MLANATTSDTPAEALYPALIVSGFALSSIFIPLQLSLFAGLGPTDVPKAAAFFSLSRQLGGGLATAILVTLLDHGTAAYQSVLAGAAQLASTPVAMLERARGPANAAQTLNLLTSRESQALGYENVTRISGWITLVHAPAPLILRRPKRTAA